MRKMTRREPRFLLNVPIHGIADRGKGVGRTDDGMAVFVEGAVPGDVVDVRILKKKGGFAEGNVERVVSPSPDRREAFCQHFDICGGCKWQNLDYAAQLRHKQQVVEDALLRIGKVEVGAFLPILGADETTHYRNKLEFGFSNRRWLTAPPSPPEGGEKAPLLELDGGVGSSDFSTSTNSKPEASSPPPGGLGGAVSQRRLENPNSNLLR